MDKIKEEIDKLFAEIKNSTLYKDYISAKKQLEENSEIMDIIKEIKRLQKIATNNKVEIIEKNIKELYVKLESYPIYQSYLIFKEELENEFRNISDGFSNYFNDILKLY